MNNSSPLISASKIFTGASLACILFLIISAFALEDAGFTAATIISAICSLIGLIVCIAAIVSKVEKTGILTGMLVFNIILLLVYGVMAMYVFFIVPVAVNEMMN